jgi:transposase
MSILTDVTKKFKVLEPIFNERQLCLWAATEARSIRHGGITMLAKLTGLAEKTVSRGIEEIFKQGRKSKETVLLGDSKSRVSGGGRKTIIEKHPDIMDKLANLLSPATRGDPESNLLWSSKSLAKLAAELKEQGISISLPTVSDLLDKLGFTKQANSKTKEGDSHEDRDEQFQFIEAESKRVQSEGNPVISIDTKKKEII